MLKSKVGASRYPENPPLLYCSLRCFNCNYKCCIEAFWSLQVSDFINPSNDFSRFQADFLRFLS